MHTTQTQSHHVDYGHFTYETLRLQDNSPTSRTLVPLDTLTTVTEPCRYSYGCRIYSDASISSVIFVLIYFLVLVAF